MSIKSSALFGPPMPRAFGERKADQTRPGFQIHDLPSGRRDRPVMTEWRLSLWGRVRVLFTGRIITTVWCDKNPPMAVEHDWPNKAICLNETPHGNETETNAPATGNDSHEPLAGKIEQ